MSAWPGAPVIDSYGALWYSFQRGKPWLDGRATLSFVADDCDLGRQGQPVDTDGCRVFLIGGGAAQR